MSGFDSADHPRTAAFDWLQPRADDPPPPRRLAPRDIMSEGRRVVDDARRQIHDLVDPITGRDVHRFVAENMVPAGGGMMGRALQSVTGMNLGVLNRLRMIRNGNSGPVGAGVATALPLALEASAGPEEPSPAKGVERRERFDPIWINRDPLSAANYEPPSPVELSMAGAYVPARGAFQEPRRLPVQRPPSTQPAGGYLEMVRKEGSGR